MIPFPTYETSDPNDSSSGSSYEFGVDSNGRLSCQCRGWTAGWKKQGYRHCVHTKGFVARNGLTFKVTGDYAYVTGGGVTGVLPVLPVVNSQGKKAKPVAQPKVKPMAAVVDDPNRKRFKTIAFLSETINPFVNPMLAESFSAGQTLENFLTNGDLDDWAMEEKYDGERKIVANLGNGIVKSWSRARSKKGGGKNDPIEFELPAHIKAAFAKLPLGSYDGELYIPGGFSSDVRKGNKNGKSTKGTEVFAVFDVVILLGTSATDKTYDERRELLTTIFEECDIDTGLELAPSVRPSLAFVQAIWDRGGEGVILKRRAAKYQPGKRSRDFIKVKALGSCIVEVYGYDKGELGPRSVILVRNPEDGSETRVASMGGGHELTKDVHTANGDKYVAEKRRLRIEYQFRTADGSYRHPRFDRWEDE